LITGIAIVRRKENRGLNAFVGFGVAGAAQNAIATMVVGGAIISPWGIAHPVLEVVADVDVADIARFTIVV